MVLAIAGHRTAFLVANPTSLPCDRAAFRPAIASRPVPARCEPQAARNPRTQSRLTEDGTLCEPQRYADRHDGCRAPICCRIEECSRRASIASSVMFPLPHAVPTHVTRLKGHSFVRPAPRAFFRPDQRNPPASARSGGQGWPRSRGHPKGLSLTAASTLAACCVSGRDGGADRSAALLTSANVPKMSSRAISPRHTLSRRCRVRS